MGVWEEGQNMSDVVVTGIGPLLANCADRGTLWTQLRDGPSQLTFEAAPGGRGERWPVGRIHGFNAERWLGRFPRQFYERYHREQQLYLSSVMIALDDADLDVATLPREDVGIFDGTSRGNAEYWYERVRAEREQPADALYSRRELLTATPGQAANLAASLLGVRGPVYTLNVTCCSGAAAIGQAYRALLHGDVDIALATGHDTALHTPMYQMYRDAGLLSDERDDATRSLRPFGDHSRNVFGEGAITLVLETRAHAARRGATPLATIKGWKLGNNGGHPLHVDPEGGRAAGLISQVLGAAGVARDDIGFVVGHGNAVEQSDRSEVAYMQRVFGNRAGEVPLLSVKPVYGHLLGASSALNVAASVLMLHHRWIVPTLNIDPARPPGPIDHVAGGGRRCDAPAALAVSFGIGGHNAVTLIGSAEAA
jgi:3-oxoacyl-[acyl-carrier-protein] synthase II